jgi:hypothetical protein
MSGTALQSPNQWQEQPQEIMTFVIQLLEIKSVVVHFQGKAFSPICLFSYQPADLREGKLIQELKLGGLNHLGKNCVCASRHISQGDFPATGRGGSPF